MPGLVTCTSVLLLTRKRLERVEKLLRGKVLSGGTVNETERQVLFLARQALKALNTGPAPSTRFDANSFTPWLAQGISKFAAMGAVGPEIARFAAQFAPGQAWLYDTLHRGNPDPLREQVLGRSTDFLLKFCERITTAVLAQPAGDKRDLLLQHMRAYALGHACHIAGAVVSAPYIDAVAFEPGTSTAPPRQKLSAAAVRGALEEGVARQVYRRTNPRGGDWNGWLPTDDDVPKVFFEAYSAAAADVYGEGARIGGSKAFNDQLARDQPPPLSARLIRDGYGTYRLLTERGYAWTYGDWLVATLFMFIPASLMFPFTTLLPQGRQMRRDDAFFAGKPLEEQRDTERAIFEVLNFPLAANGFVPFVMSLWLMLGSYSGAGRETLFGVVNGAVALVAAIVFFATLHTDIPGWVRWGLLFALPLGLEIAHIAYVLKRGGQDKRHWQLAMTSITHIGIAIFFVVAFVAFLHFGVEAEVDEGLRSSKFWWLAVAWLGIVVVLWLVTSGFLTKLDNSLPGVTRNDFATARKHYLRLFDDTTLGTAFVPDPPTLADRLFPNEREPILKLWWTGAGTLFVRSDRNALVFAFAADGSGTQQTVLAPIAPMSALEYGALLQKAVQDSAGGFSRQLRVELFHTDEPLVPQLGTGEVFADHGDAEATAEGHAGERTKFRPVPAPDQDPYLLLLAPRDAIAIRMGQTGAVPAQAGAVALNGPGQITPIAAPGSVNVVGDAAARFLDTFVPGDVIETTGPAANQARVVVAVADNQHLTVNLAFTPFAAAQNYRRRIRDRETDLTGAGTIANDANVFRQVQGNATVFDVTLRPGDTILATPPGGAVAESRVVTAVLSPTLITVDSPFSVAIPNSSAALPWAGFVRPGRLSAQGHGFAPADPTVLFAGDTVLDRAADLATLLCLGTTSRLLQDAERAAVAGGAVDARHSAVDRAHQVFRNWNLDRRRVNEWRMLIGGHAVSEKHGNADQRDALQPGMPEALRTGTPGGEAFANAQGWVPLFTRWLDMAQRADSDTHGSLALREGEPSNLELTQGLAYLLNLPEPA